MPANYILLSEQTVTTSVASVTFANIPQTGYTDLKIVVSARSSGAESAGGAIGIVTFNGSSSNLTARILGGNGTTAYSSTDTAIGVRIDPGDVTANTFGSSEIYIPNYRAASAKSFSVDHLWEQNLTFARTELTAGLLNSSTAISSVTFTAGSGSFVANSTFSLYGVAAFGVTPTVLPKASGGDVIVNDGTYWYHAFLSSGVFAPNQGLTCDVLQIAGGGGGGGQANNNSAGAGGGAGGLRYFAGQPLVATPQMVLVGAGGAGGSNLSGTNGASSQFGALTVSTGGGGGGTMGSNGLAGGSGGGGGSNFQTPALSGGAASPAGQGNAGGNSTAIAQDSNFNSGGGGGSGAVGGNGSNATGGNGGAGLNTYSSWATVTNTGVSGFYAGGGGGVGFTTVGTGSNGGGNGNFNGSPQNAVAFTGSGGGGGAYKSGINTPTAGGNGGSGVVIVRYTMV